MSGATGTADKKGALLVYARAMDAAKARAERAEADARDPFLKAERMPLQQHLENWHASLIAKRNTARYAEQMRGRVRRVLEGCGFTFVQEIGAVEVQNFIAELAGPRLCDSTRNKYIKAVKQFCRWLTRNRRLRMNPVECLDPKAASKTFRRRALSGEELAELLAYTRSGPDRWRMSGTERAALYELAAVTGLRVSELASLTWGSLELDGGRPVVTVEAAYSKRRRDDVLPLKASTVRMLTARREQLGRPAAAVRLFDVPELNRFARMLRQDLRGARARWIRAAGNRAERRHRYRPGALLPENDDGRVDFHALRHTFISGLARAGIAPKLAQDLARHSTITLTMDHYSHTVLSERAAAVEALPDFEAAPRKAAKAG